MNQICRITVESTRSAVSFGALPTATERDEEWDEELFDEDVPEELLEDDLPGDGWKKSPPALSPTPPNTTLLHAYGVYSYEEDGSFRVSYEDSEITGLEGCLTTFCYSTTGMLIMLRRGPVKTCMVFEKGRRHLCDYGAEMGFPSVSLQTQELDFTPRENGGDIRVRYSVDAGGALAERNELIIHVEKEA